MTVCQACQWEWQELAQLGLHPVLRPQEGTQLIGSTAEGWFTNTEIYVLVNQTICLLSTVYCLLFTVYRLLSSVKIEEMLKFLANCWLVSE